MLYLFTFYLAFCVEAYLYFYFVFCIENEERDMRIIKDLLGWVYIHHGNCRFCKERKQKELKELGIKLKEK